MTDLAKIDLRVGSNPNYLNVDFDRVEIGYLLLAARGVVTVWAHDLQDRAKLEAVRRIVEPVVIAMLRSL